MSLFQNILNAVEKVGSVVGPIEDLFVLLKLYAPDPANPNKKVPDPKHASTWAKKKEHDDLWGLLTNRLTPGEQTEILQEMFPRLKEIQQCDFIISAASMASQKPPVHASTINPFDETVAHLKRIAAIKGTDDDHTHQLRMKEADALNLVRFKPEDYRLYAIEQALGAQFTDPNSFTRYVARYGKQAVVNSIASINIAIGQPANAATGTLATGQVAVANNFLARQKAKYDASKR
jgi:hypothetical protein